MKIVIIEDESLLADELEEVLIRIYPSFQVVAKLDSIKSSVEWLSANEYDIIFIDIHLSDGISFSIFKKIDIKSPVIFTTSYDMYAIKAFEVNSIAYILKPIEESDIIKAFDKYKHHINNIKSLLSSPSYFGVTESNSEQVSSYTESLVLSQGPIKRVCDVENIIYFQADDRYVFAIIQEGDKMFCSVPLKELESSLDPCYFFRINRTYIVNRNFISHWKSGEKGRISVFINRDAHASVLPINEDILSVNKSISLIVSSSRSAKFKKWISKKKSK